MAAGFHGNTQQSHLRHTPGLATFAISQIIAMTTTFNTTHSFATIPQRLLQSTDII